MANYGRISSEFLEAYGTYDAHGRLTLVHTGVYGTYEAHGRFSNAHVLVVGTYDPEARVHGVVMEIFVDSATTAAPSTGLPPFIQGEKLVALSAIQGQRSL